MRFVKVPTNNAHHLWIDICQVLAVQDFDGYLMITMRGGQFREVRMSETDFMKLLADGGARVVTDKE